jgi:hypothetical protein
VSSAGRVRISSNRVCGIVRHAAARNSGVQQVDASRADSETCEPQVGVSELPREESDLKIFVSLLKGHVND